MRRLLVGLMTLAVTGAVGAPIAQGDPPTVTPAPQTDFVDTSSCAFPVSVHFTINGETTKTFTNGTTIITGPLFAQFSANGKTVSLNVSGPVKLTASGAFLARGVGAGPTLTPSGIVLAYSAGVVDASSGVLEHGHILLNICAALAP
jgi:hypothetical protein